MLTQKETTDGNIYHKHCKNQVKNDQILKMF